MYGNDRILPLIGGSGGMGYAYNFNTGSTLLKESGGGGGGAILIACANAIAFTSNGLISANGAAGGYWSTSGGSGGAIRLIADEISIDGGGRLRAEGAGYSGNGVGGTGRIRLESNNTSIEDIVPPPSIGLPGEVATLWPPQEAPTVEIESIGMQAVPVDPRANLDFPNADVPLTDPGVVTIRLVCTNVPPPPAGSMVVVRIIPKTGTDTRDSTIEATFVSGDLSMSVWEADFMFGEGFSAVQARAILPTP